ncbi:MAG: RluA family pseudouridine synthase [Myxococcota bacterium]
MSRNPRKFLFALCGAYEVSFFAMEREEQVLPLRVDIPYREESGAKLYTITLLETIEPTRLDKVISLALPELSRSRAERLIAEGQVTVNGRTAVKGGMSIKSPPLEIKIFVPAPPPTELVALDMPLDIVYEDEFIVVLNKPAGIVMHPSAGHSTDTLANALIYHFDKLSARGGKYRLGVVHRLDKDTSGVLVVTKEDKTHFELSRQFSSRRVEKCYIGVVFGKPEPPAGEIKAPIIRHPRLRKQFTSRTQRGREAITRYETEGSSSGLSVVRCFPKTGRTHQIRVHLAEQLACPIVGDDLYGARRRIKSLPEGELKGLVEKASRHLLHAFSISFTHPATGRRVYFEAAAPSDMRFIMEKMGVRLS